MAKIVEKQITVLNPKLQEIFCINTDLSGVKLIKSSFPHTCVAIQMMREHCHELLICNTENKSHDIYSLPADLHQSNVVAYWNDYLIINHNNSQQKGSILYKPGSGQLSLYTEHFQFFALDENKVLFHKGADVISLNENMEWSHVLNVGKKNNHKKMILSSRKTESDDAKATSYKEIIEKRCRHQPKGEVSYIENDGMLYISYYLCEGKEKQAYFMAAHLEQTYCIVEKLAVYSGEKQVFPEFFVLPDTIVCTDHCTFIKLLSKPIL